MSVPVVTLTASTADAVSGSAPYTVSRDTAKDDLTYSWSISFTGLLGYWQERLGGSLRTGGQKLNSLGVVCGMTRIAAPGARILQASSSPLTKTSTSIDIDGYLPSEGDYRFGVDAANADGWSSTS